MAFSKTYYTPIEAAIRWSNLMDHEKEILMAASHCPEKLSCLFPQWPSLGACTERIYEAINWHELPAGCLGQPIALDVNIDRSLLTVRHIDLYRWTIVNHPNEKPSFLFEQSGEHRFDASLGTVLKLQVDRDVAERELHSIRKQLHQLSEEFELMEVKCERLTKQLESRQPDSEQGQIVPNRIIGGLLDLVLGQSSDGKPYSRFRTQAAIVDTLISRHPGVYGLSKRTLDRKFAEAKRSLEDED